MTHILIPREPSPALLRPFVGCPQEELPQAYAAMIRIAEVERARAGSQCLAQIEEPAGAAPAAVAPFGYVNTYTGQFLFDVEPCRKDNEGHWRTVYLQPAAVAPQGGYPPLPEPVADWVQRGSVSIGGGSLGHEISREVVFTAAQMRAYFDLGRQTEAPALEAPAAPAVPAGFALVPIEPTQQMLDAGRLSGAGSVSIQEEWARKEVWSRMLATVTPPPAAYADDLVALVTELVQALRKATPDNDLAGHALDYLKRNGLQESPLRAADTAPQAPAAPSGDERAAYVAFLAGKFPRSYGKEEAGRWWDQGHVSALAWQAARHWNPLADDGDAFRLAVALWLEIRVFNGKAHAGRQDRFWCTEECGDDPGAAARRAVVRAAAHLAAQAAAKGEHDAS